MGSRTVPTTPPPELESLRRKVTELVAQNAVSMVQETIDAVREDGQFQAMKYLFEMIGLYPAIVKDDTQSQDSLAQILLETLGLREAQRGDAGVEKPTRTKGRLP